MDHIFDRVVYGVKLIILILSFACSSSSSSSISNYNNDYYYYMNSLIGKSKQEHRNFTAISDFRLVNRRILNDCVDLNPYQRISVASNSNLGDDQIVTVTVSGVLFPSDDDWVAMISPSHAKVNACPFIGINYAQTGDFTNLPLLCHYPVKSIFLKKDPDYLSCKKKECNKQGKGGKCEVTTCSATVSFHVINIRTDISFVFFGGGFDTPCTLARTSPLPFLNPNMPLHAHLNSIDSTSTSMRVTWVSGDNKPQQVQYGDGKTQTSLVTTFTQKDMCKSDILVSPAKDFGWHDPGFIHSAVMSGLLPLTNYTYRYGSDSVGWSEQIQFKTPPEGGSDELKFLAFGDMGKAPKDASIEHYIQPGSISVTDAMGEEVKAGNVDSIFHIGDISYATGFLVEWDFFLHQIFPVASRVSYMTAIGNHERDYMDSGSVYVTPDSGGECGVPYETYFQMPTLAKDKPWYSIEQGTVHFTVISTEHNWKKNSEQYLWMKKDMASINRAKTPWLIFMGHRPMYTSSTGLFSVDTDFAKEVEPLLLANKVDLVLFGHVHNYERTCSVYKNSCLAMPNKDQSGVDTYDHNNYSAPVHAVIGMAGFSLDKFPNDVKSWSLRRISEFGYLRAHATKQDITLEFVNTGSRKIEDSFRIIKKQQDQLNNRKIKNK
ncbi:probable inactive purple acid phosphatase 27 [Cannabis sativa]|uniref:probable inactive purple acid phosphatase 27 n=1 Tax=Cannabis sativa TaxID=3483 RepID=UPI0029CA5B6C|nr:probable inactive purple acid phosphatase 27 [Cannabis sativa]